MGQLINLTSDERQALRTLLNKRKVENLVSRRANALLLLDEGLDVNEVSRVLYLNVESLYRWQREFSKKRLSFLPLKAYKSREGHLSCDQEQKVKEHFRQNPPRNTGEVRAYIREAFEVEFSRSGAIKLMKRLGFSYKKPRLLPLKAKPEAQQAFIREYRALSRSLPDDEAIVFGDAVHPEYQSKPAYGWFLKESRPALSATSGRKRLNIHAALNLETFSLQWVEAERINAETTRHLLEKVEQAHPGKRKIHLFLDNARYHHAKALKPWLKDPGRRLVLHFLPAYCPHLNPIERLWGVMHKTVTHNRCYESFKDFVEAVLNFLRRTLPERWKDFRDTITDNFRVITDAKHDIIR